MPSVADYAVPSTDHRHPSSGSATSYETEATCYEAGLSFRLVYRYQQQVDPDRGWVNGRHDRYRPEGLENEDGRCWKIDRPYQIH